MSSPLRDVTTLFLRLGFTAFGGPAAHVALMRDEVVRRRQWLDDARFLDLVGLSNLVPGPNSTELAIHLGRERAGWRGFGAAGVAFIAPAMLLVMGLGWGYAKYGALPQATALLAGVKAVMIAIIAQALWALGPKAVKGRRTALLGAGALAAGLMGANEIVLLFGTGLAALALEGRVRFEVRLAVVPLPVLTGAAVAHGVLPFSLPTLFLSFLKIGAVMYGSGYVLLAFLRAEFVERLGWLDGQQLLDAIAIGQVTPGPLFTAATFIGHLLGGVPGALLATLGIFLPSFLFVALTAPLLEKRRDSRALATFLDGVNVASLALMFLVTWQLGRFVVADPPLAVVALVSLALLLRTRVSSVWLVAGGALLGLARGMAG